MAAASTRPVRSTRASAPTYVHANASFVSERRPRRPLEFSWDAEECPRNIWYQFDARGYNFGLEEGELLLLEARTVRVIDDQPQIYGLYQKPDGGHTVEWVQADVIPLEQWSMIVETIGIKTMKKAFAQLIPSALKADKWESDFGRGADVFYRPPPLGAAASRRRAHSATRSVAVRIKSVNAHKYYTDTNCEYVVSDGIDDFHAHRSFLFHLIGECKDVGLHDILQWNVERAPERCNYLLYTALTTVPCFLMPDSVFKDMDKETVDAQLNFTTDATMVAFKVLQFLRVGFEKSALTHANRTPFRARGSAQCQLLAIELFAWICANDTNLTVRHLPRTVEITATSFGAFGARGLDVVKARGSRNIALAPIRFCWYRTTQRLSIAGFNYRSQFI